MPARTGLPAKTRVLLLGRDPALERDLIAALQSESCEVVSAADGRKALDMARKAHVDVLVLDFDTHPRECSRLTLKLSLAERGHRTLVLASSLEQLTHASETGADGVLMKPLDPRQVRTVIHNLLAGAYAQTLAGRWPPDPFFEAPPSQRDCGINE